MLPLKQAGFHYYLLGLIILTLGIALAIQSGLGTSPFDALLVGLYRTFGLTIGSWEIVVGGAMILCNAIALRRRPEFFVIITSVVTGIGIDIWVFIVRDLIVPSTWLGQWICLILSIILTGLGVAIYLQSRISPNPLDRSMVIMSDMTGLSITYSRAIISVVLVIVAFFFDGAIGIGTVVNAILVGLLISFFIPYVQKSIS